ncbi:MAG: nucleotidyl transferase AbiEii/AbiGii toxin family protein [Spirochaetes bacterium]|nr:nucleotidyl transferase AbiEii/AbiGii toxin family protein [Spirochaetota bacterium]
MEGIADYDILYSEQDVVLNTLKEIDTGFYLTGGTCIHRFYLDYRYSDDLDFFCNDNDLFRDYAREYFEFLKSKQLYFEYLVDTRDFIRILFNKKLKIDFVNDRVFRYNKIERSKEGYKIDNIFNILANKITAVISRDEPKDVFDICSISMNYNFSWKEIIEIAKKKCYFEIDFLADRIQSFPTVLFDRINAKGDIFIEKSKIRIREIVKNILNEEENVKMF